MTKTVYGKPPRKSPLAHRIIRFDTSSDGNNQLVVITSFMEESGYTAYVFTTQYAPDAACLLYKFDIGRLTSFDDAIAVACKLLAERLRLAATFFDSKFIEQEKTTNG